MKDILLALIRFYRKSHAALGGRATCRYYPTCSQYGLDAVEGYGAFRGFLLTAWRILRCNPLGKTGYDPCPSTSWESSLKKESNIILIWEFTVRIFPRKKNKTKTLAKLKKH